VGSFCNIAVVLPAPFGAISGMILEKWIFSTEIWTTSGNEIDNSTSRGRFGATRK